MDFNNFVFPAPDVSWYHNEFLGELLWVPVKRKEVDAEVFNRRVAELSEKVAGYN